MGCEFRRMVSGRGFLAAFLLCMAGIVLGTSWPDTKNVLDTGQFLALEKAALMSKVACYLLPVTAVLPWSDSFLSEWKSGFLKTALPRIGRRCYVENKILAVALSGFLVWLGAGAAVMFGYFLAFFPLEKRGIPAMEDVLGVLLPLLRCGLIASIFASLGGVCGALGGSAYLAFGIPFVGYYFCMILQERYFPDALWLYPPQWISGAANWGEDQEGLWMFLFLALAVAMGCHAAVLYGKIEAQ